MNKLCVICPTRNRPKRLKSMLMSFRDTKDITLITDLILAVDNDDDNNLVYDRMTNYYKCSKMVFRRKNITHYINAIFLTMRSRYHSFMVINDDFIFKTKNWNRILLEQSLKPSIAYPRDGNQDGVVPTTFTIPTVIAEAVGWLQLPTLTHLYGDTVWQTIMKKCNINGYCPDVLIEHHHPMYKKADDDEIYQRTNSKEMYSKDQDAFRHWLSTEAINDCNKIQRVLGS